MGVRERTITGNHDEGIRDHQTTLFLPRTLHFYGQLKSYQWGSSQKPWALKSSLKAGYFLLFSTLSLTVPKPEVVDLGLRFLIFKGLVPAAVGGHASSGG